MLYICWKFVRHQSRNSGENNADVRIFTYVHPGNTANALKDLRGYFTKIREIFIRPRAIICGFNAIIEAAILPTIVECQRSERRRGVSIFANTRLRSVTIATSLNRAVAIWIYCYKAHWSLYVCWTFGEDQCIDSGENNANVFAYFCICASTHYLQTRHNISVIYCTKIHEIILQNAVLSCVSVWV